MAVTLLDARKQLVGRNQILPTIMEQYASSSDLMRAMRFENITGNALTFNKEASLPTVAFRSLNEGFVESTGRIETVTETLMAAGGYIDCDRYLIATGGPDVLASQQAMKVKSLSLEMTKAILKADHSVDRNSFDGLQARIDGNQLIEAKATPTSGGDALALSKLDELKDAVQTPTHWIMNKRMRSLLTQAARNTSVGGFITFGQDEFGRRITLYDDLPILIVDEDSTGAQILAFDEVGGGGGTAQCTSIYCVSMADDGVKMLQSGPMDIRDLGEIHDKPVFRTVIEWYLTLAIMRSKAAARLRGVKYADVVKSN